MCGVPISERSEPTTTALIRRAGLTWLAASLIACGAPSPSHTPGPIVGLDWATATVERPAGFDPASPGATPQPAGSGTAGHPGHFSGQAHMVDVTAATGGLVAVGFRYPGWHATAWQSSDGTAWRLASVEGDDEATFMYAVAASTAGQRLSAVGLHGSRPAAWWSDDGAAWHPGSVSSAAEDKDARMTAVADGGEGFVAGGSSGVVTGPGEARFWTAIDGSAWDDATVDVATDGRVAAIAAGQSTMVAVGTTGSVGYPTGSTAWTSADGHDWHRVPSQSTLAGVVLRSVISFGSGFVAVGDLLDGTRAAVLMSDDGVTWRTVEDQPSFSYHDQPIRMTDIALMGDGLVAVGHHLFGQQFGSATSWTSDDGVAWQRAGASPVFPQGEMLAVAAAADTVVAVGTFGAPDNYIPTAWFSPSR
jgi:hypothetical protein